MAGAGGATRLRGGACSVTRAGSAGDAIEAVSAVGSPAGAASVEPWSVVIGVLVGCAVLLAAGPRGRGTRGTGRVAGGGRPGAGVLARMRRALPARFASPPGSATGAAPSVQVLVTQVAGLLRGGVAPGQVWPMVGPVRVDPRGVPDADDLAALVVAGPLRGAAAVTTHRQVAAIVAACRLAAEVGAPLAGVLDAIVGTLEAAARAEHERAAALAGPRSTARVLAWLPGIGAVLGMALGADPVGLLLAGGLGAMAPVLGVVLIAVGHRWTARLLARARDAGEPP